MAQDREKLAGRWKRSLKTALLGSSVGGRHVGGRIADALRGKEAREEAQLARHLESAKQMARTMRELRGPILKVGQLLSTHAEALPGEYGEILRSLQQQAPPMGYGTIRAVIEEELGAPPEALFEDFTEEAVAAASLGQVHKARLGDGTELAVKVQYPGAEESVAGDLKNIDVGARMIKKVLVDVAGKRRLDMTPVAEELAEHLMQETDYCREAYNAKLLGKLFEGDPEIVVPRVHDAYSGLRVVSYDWLEGEELDSALKHDEAAARTRVVRQLVHAFWHQMFRGGVLHADPHPGNYRILPDGRLGLLDYGCVKIFDEGFMREFGEMVVARLDGDDERLRRCMIALDLIDDPDSAEELEDMRRISTYCSVGIAEDADFDFSDFSYVAEAKKLVRYFLGRRTVPPAQRDFLFLTRVVLAYYEYFSRAGARMNFRRLVEPYVRNGYEGRTIEVPPYG